MISIIVPVYNVEKFLDDCLLSISKQSFKDWECILVDDGSSDSSGLICDYWGKRDTRFVVIHNQNQGVSISRNIGLEYANGELICFVDSDDWVDVHYLQRMFDAMQNNIDLVVAGFSNVRDGRTIENINPVNNGVYSLKGCDCTKFIFDIDFFYGPVSKLYKKDIIVKNHIAFPVDLSLGEDMSFVFSYLRFVDKINSISESLYFYRRSDSGTLSTIKRKNLIDIYMRLWNLRVDFFRTRNLWNDIAEKYFAFHLWGNVYDSLFNSKFLSYSQVKRILSIVDISLLRKWYEIYPCSNWIKWCIVKQMSMLLYIFISLKRD